MQSLQFWLHRHISSLLFNKLKQFFTFFYFRDLSWAGTLAIPEQNHSPPAWIWPGHSSITAARNQIMSGRELKPLQKHGQTWKESTRALFQCKTPPTSGTAPAFTWKSQTQNTWTESTVVIHAGRMRILTSLCSHFPGLSQETGGHLDSLMK